MTVWSCGLLGCRDRVDAAVPRTEDPELILTEEMVYRLEAGENVSGAIPLGEEAIAYWGSEGLWRVDRTRTRTQIVCYGRGLGIVGGGQTARGAVFFDSLSNAVYEVTRVGGCRKFGTLAANRLISGIATDSGWLTIDQLKTAKARLVFYPYGRGSRRPLSHELPGFAQDSSEASWLYLSSADDGAIPGSRRAPFGWVLLTPMGVATPVGSSRAYPSVPGMIEQGSSWIALPVIQVDQGYLQMHADLSSDKRRFKVFDRDGNLLRTRELIAPIGIYARYGNRLLAVRITDATELVLYGWRWRTH